MSLESKSRWLIRRDLPQVIEINCNNGVNILSEEEFIKVLRGRQNIGQVYETEYDVIEAYTIYQLHKTRLEILMLEGSPEGKLHLLNKMFGKLSHDRRVRLDAEIHECDMGLLCMLRDLGFRTIGSQRNYFNERDAIYMSIHIEEVSDLEPV